MPIYEYECASCGHRFERKQSFNSEPIAECPECGAPARRVLQPAGIIFKGSGWYKTDSRKSNGAASSTSGNGSDKESSAKSEPAKKESASVEP